MKKSIPTSIIIKGFVISTAMLWIGLLAVLVFADFLVNGFDILNGLDPRIFSQKMLLNLLGFSVFFTFIVWFVILLQDPLRKKKF